MNKFKLSHLQTTIDICSDTQAVTIDQVWEKLVDWQGQSEWMLATKVWSLPSSIGASEEGSGIGVEIFAFTGLFAGRYSPKKISSRLGILDAMVVRVWQPPMFCEVAHVGAIIKGSGEFRLEPITGGVRFHWLEVIEAPWPILILLRPGILFGVKLSLRRFRTLCLAEALT
ncbi:MAG: SRPBCC family protein [Actinomycetes bacterium]